MGQGSSNEEPSPRLLTAAKEVVPDAVSTCRVRLHSYQVQIRALNATPSVYLSMGFSGSACQPVGTLRGKLVVISRAPETVV